MRIGIDPKVDYAFRRLFGHPKNGLLLCSLLNAILKWPEGRQIVVAVVRNPFLAQETFDGKSVVLDIRAQDQLGRTYNIEMQIRRHLSLEERVLFYWSSLYSQQLNYGENYTHLKPTISVLLMGDVLFPKLPDGHNRFRLWDDSQQQLFSEHLDIHVVELAKFSGELEAAQSELERWVYFLKHADDVEFETWREKMPNTVFEQAAEELRQMAMNPLERERYEARLKGLRDYSTDMQGEREEGIEQGLEQGLELGELRTTIRFLEFALRRPVSSLVDLSTRTLVDLRQQAAALTSAANEAGIAMPPTEFSTPKSP